MALTLTTPETDTGATTIQVLDFTPHMPIGGSLALEVSIIRRDADGKLVGSEQFQLEGSDVDAAVAPVYDGVKTALYQLLLDRGLVPPGTIS